MFSRSVFNDVESLKMRLSEMTLDPHTGGGFHLLANLWVTDAIKEKCNLHVDHFEDFAYPIFEVFGDFLIQKGGLESLNRPFFADQTLLTLASSLALPKVVEMIVNKGANVNALNHSEENAMKTAFKAIHKNCGPVSDIVHCIALLLNKGCDIDHIGRNNESLIISILSNTHISEECLEIALKGGANPNECSQVIFPGLRALHIAIIHNNKNAMELLLEAGADMEALPSKAARNQISPLNLAKQRGDSEIIQLLESYKTVLDEKRELEKVTTLSVAKKQQASSTEIADKVTDPECLDEKERIVRPRKNKSL